MEFSAIPYNEQLRRHEVLTNRKTTIIRKLFVGQFLKARRINNVRIQTGS